MTAMTTFSMWCWRFGMVFPSPKPISVIESTHAVAPTTL